MSEGQAMVEAAGRPVLLRAAREAAGLHIAALAAALKVPVRKLEALEAGRYDELPDLTFARALASSACRHLKIDPAPVLEQIPQSVMPELGDSPRAINAPFKAASEPAQAGAMTWLSRPALLAAIALLLGALVIVFLPHIQDGAASVTDTVTAPVEPSGGQESEAEERTPLAVPLEPSSDAASAPVSTAPEAVSEPVQASAAATPPAPAGQAAATASALAEPVGGALAAGGSLLSIAAATGESWVEVTNGSGSVVVQRLLKPGEAVDFSTAPPYTVVLGRAEAARVTVRGRPFDVNAIARNNVARFEVR
ncbi:helix-turn-helix domain-containing protein [Hydrogenophaga sp.]|uniref:helix-turn-helix domain-containing protein n=1 Tax=Hydrogenophaga sp. TaxID=1904254 RepID=UPI002624B331|nr:helix-turn-helix domain-containing protein [Hydrogenophaga sp.]MCW5652167.1 helix-turn-helix domain-containing protein [Hydrogenophaga sp.]